MSRKVDEIHAIARKYSIPVLEDSAEALGSHYKIRNVALKELLMFCFLMGTRLLPNQQAEFWYLKIKK